MYYQNPKECLQYFRCQYIWFLLFAERMKKKILMSFGLFSSSIGEGSLFLKKLLFPWLYDTIAFFIPSCLCWHVFLTQVLNMISLRLLSGILLLFHILSLGNFILSHSFKFWLFYLIILNSEPSIYLKIYLFV